MDESCMFSSLQIVIFFMQNLKIKWLWNDDFYLFTIM